MTETNEKPQVLPAANKIRMTRILIGCLLGSAIAFALGFLRFFNAANVSDMGVAVGLSLAEFIVCVAIAIFVEHRRLARLRWRQNSVEFERLQNGCAEAERWKNEVNGELNQTEQSIKHFETDVKMHMLRSNSIEELKKVARKAVLDGYRQGLANVKREDITGGLK